MPKLPADDIDFILSRTEPLWEEMRENRLFLTGGTGFFGCWLVESFLAANTRFALNAQVTLLSRSPKAFREKCPYLASDPALSFVEGDVRDFQFPEGDYPFIIHAATEASARLIAEKPLQMLSTVIDGTKRTLDFAVSHGTRKFLLTSSGAVYGEQPAAMSHIAEDYAGAPNPLDPGSVYSEGKRASELLCAVYGADHAIECKIARCFAFVGPHLPLDTHFAVGNFLRDAMRGEVIRVNGDGTPKRSYMYAADLAVWLWTLLFLAKPMDALNVGSDQVVSIADLAKVVSDTIGSGAGIHIMRQATVDTPIRQYVPNVDKAALQLGLRREISLQEAIRRTAAWHGYSIKTETL